MKYKYKQKVLVLPVFGKADTAAMQRINAAKINRMTVFLVYSENT